MKRSKKEAQHPLNKPNNVASNEKMKGRELKQLHSGETK
jgi:hypothetical protein